MTRLDLALRLRELRRWSGMSQRQLAAAAHVGEKSLSSWETGERTDAMKVRQLERICEACGVSLAVFLDAAVEIRCDVAAEGWRVSA